MAENKKQMSLIEAQKIKQMMDDPVIWAQIFVTIFDNATKKYTPWTARWYQVEMLRDRSIKKVARCGRRTGKCLTGDNLILDSATGELVTVEEAFNRGFVHVGTMTDDYKLQAHYTNEIWENGIKPVYEIITQTGRHIKATGNHPFFTVEGWKEIDDLTLNDYVGLANNNQFFGTDTMRKDELKAFALYYSNQNKTDLINKYNVEDYKGLHPILFKLKRKLLIAFLRYIYEINPTFQFNNLQIAEDIQHILLRFGINSCTKNNAVIILKQQDNKFPSQLNNLYADLKIKEDQLLTAKELLNYATETNNEDLIALANTDIIFDKIVSIKYIGEEMTYDVAVSITNNFIANDFVTHNTETMCIEMLWKAFTKPMHRILVVTPYETQVRLILTRLNEIINESPLLKKELKRVTKNPYWIEFNNGAIICGFTTGASSGSGGASIRGQRADAIYMDEVD